MKLPTRQNGFTLIELILYIGLASIILLTTSAFLGTLLESRIKNTTVAEVEGQGVQVMQIMTQTVRNSENINSPSTGASSPTLSLNVIDSGNDPTIFDLSAGTIRIKEGSDPVISLTNSRVQVSNLVFRNLSRASTPGTIEVRFTISHINPENKNVYNYSKTFIGVASVRQP